IGLHPVIARSFLSRWRGPIVATWDDYHETIWRANYGRLAGLFMRWFERQIMVHSDYIITISRYNQQRAEAWGKKTWYIPNGCDTPEYDVEACETRLDGKLKLVYCGDQGKYKRTYEIVQAMSKVPKDIKLYLVGTPYEYLQPYASDNVIFLGRLPENDKWSIMSQADVLVCTADTDCNAKFHEYLRVGKPILGYDGIANHLFQNRRNALLTRNYPAAIMELCRSPELRAELAANAARDIPVYTWHEIAQQYDQAFAEIARLHGAKNQ
ncbi:MAG: glycosyltransferase, partial [Lentisphaerae bacterium]|nr:glycosyltransferase [Lentisphaerota bacterium]